MKRSLTYRSTIFACYNGYIVQAICLNLAPLLYITFRRSFGLSLGQISLLIAVNFIFQLLIDLAASGFADRLNLRAMVLVAHLFAALGLAGLSLLPFLLPPYIGLLISVGLLGVGGGLIEVVISPLMEACPTDEKSANMSLLHSFYCWGQAGVVLLSGVFFSLTDLEHDWRILPLLWTVIPLAGVVAFSMVPVYRLPASAGEERSGRGLFRSKRFWLFSVMMFCAGAAELTMSQWASGFAESALGVNKTLGDLLGPCMFAVMMGSARLLYGKFSSVLRLDRLMLWSCVLCVAAYLLAALAPHPIMALTGCMLCGLSVGIFWPGILSTASAELPGGGIAMFALLALAGDVGCLIGPSAAGQLAELWGGDLRRAFCFALIFPILCLCALLIRKKK